MDNEGSAPVSAQEAARNEEVERSEGMEEPSLRANSNEAGQPALSSSRSTRRSVASSTGPEIAAWRRVRLISVW